MLSPKQFKAQLASKAWAAYEKRADKVTAYIGEQMEANRPEMTRQLHNLAGPTSPFYDRSKNQ